VEKRKKGEKAEYPQNRWGRGPKNRVSAGAYISAWKTGLEHGVRLEKTFNLCFWGKNYKCREKRRRRGGGKKKS